MIIQLLIIILTTLALYYFYTYKTLHKYFKDRDVKFLPGWPIFGNIFGLTFLKRHFWYDLEEVYNAFPDERYVGFVELTTPVVLIRDPEIIKNITVKDFNYFTDRKEVFSDRIDSIFNNSLATMKGNRWRDMRNSLSPAFTSSKIKNMLPSILEIVNNVVKYLNEHQDEDIYVDDLMHRYTIDVITSAGLGIRVDSIKDRDNDFYKIGNRMLDLNLKQRLLAFFDNQFPALSKIFGFQLYPEKTHKFCSNIAASTIEYRKQQNIERTDLIHLLMKTEKDWTPDEITGQVFLFFGMGNETPACTLTMTLHELALNPDIQDKLYEECERFKDQVFSFEIMNELKYLDAVVNETLRKWCPAVVMERTCTKTYVLPPPREGGRSYVIKPGELVYNLVNPVQMDPKYWPEPNKYDPERFLEENKRNIKPFTFMPFGVGPRTCIGMRYALMEIKALIYHLILNFKVVNTANTMDPIKLQPHSYTMKTTNGTHVRFERRLSQYI